MMDGFRSLCYMSLITNVAFAQLCNDGRFGEGDPKSKDDDIESNVAYGYMMNDPDYVVDCCGTVDRWEAHFDNVAGTRTIYFQVWRPIAGGNSYTLVGQNEMTVTNNGEQDISIAQASRITILPNDRWGWWTSGTDIITYKTGGGEEDNNHMMTLGSLAEGNTQDWSGATVRNDRSYAIRMDRRTNNRPTFSNLDGAVTISNQIAIGTPFFTVTATDQDTYDISSLVITMDTNPSYSVDPTTGVVTSAASLSGPGRTETLKFTVTDQCSNTRTNKLTITITNEPPVINSLPDSTSIAEDVTAETLLHVINATDPDSNPTCDLAGSTPATYPFKVQDNKLYSESFPGFDYNTQRKYDLTISCTDGDLSDTGTFTVYLIKNQAPVFINLQNSTSISTTTLIGSTAFSVIVTDAENDDVTFTMTCDPSPCPFEIFDSGDIQVSQDLTGHTTVGYDIEITVSDGRNTVGPSILTITLADINDPVSVSNLPVGTSILENVAVGTLIYTVSYNDLDVTQTRIFTMTSSPVSGMTYFTIDSSTGVVSTTSLINYEALASKTFTLSVTVSDPVTSDTGTLTVEVANENEAPTFSQTAYSLSTTEGNAGAVLGTPAFGISDPDAGDTHVLALDCGAMTGYFMMDPSTGQVSFQSDYDLDSGALPTSVSCTVTVTDSGALTDTATLDISITDANDHTPVFAPASYNFYISYYAKPGTVVGVVTATDQDGGSHGTLTYTLDQASLLDEYFTIASDGTVSVRLTPQGSALGYATSVTVVATATDTGGLLDTANVLIVISDTTTTSTTTTTDRYRTFLEDSKNVVWLSAAVGLLLVSAGVTIYVLYTCFSRGSGNFCKNMCRRSKNPRKFRSQRRYSMDRFDTPRPRRSPVTEISLSNKRSVRHPPPPIEQQSWRGGILA